MWRSGPRNILSAVFFTHGRKILYKETLPDSLSWKKKHFVMLSNENGSHDKKSMNTWCESHLLPIYLSVCLSICCSSLIYLSTPQPSRSFLALRKSINTWCESHLLPIYLSVCLSICCSSLIYLSTPQPSRSFQALWKSINTWCESHLLPIYLSVCLSVCCSSLIYLSTFQPSRSF